mmetsp:Transcript_972/g.2032  ORF Transcript_972/g.2032 Transcript_972/m.2032 type:complete len:90 (+) Transcript_972:224-493(+)|eukprot:CAMPEP_0172305628 /NCGR_PEP_ID=MMETSP1058-20130122/6883_1 /TAXON_ID=83371 /ORGANISM="Detonula confervacea, Strain CCMP 353" /LENGTH=89 /DNA_ID=CAMNT_0013017289 /DNA_START=177 /DNA_END=446 /DNA_ORIENTATION=+
MWSRPPLPPSATTASYGDVDSYHNPSGSPPALGAANTINGADAASDDDGGNGWMFTHSSIVGQINDRLPPTVCPPLGCVYPRRVMPLPE